MGVKMGVKKEVKMGVKMEVKMGVMCYAQDNRLLMNTPFGNVQHAVLNSLERQFVNFHGQAR